MADSSINTSSKPIRRTRGSLNNSSARGGYASECEAEGEELEVPRAEVGGGHFSWAALGGRSSRGMRRSRASRSGSPSRKSLTRASAARSSKGSRISRGSCGVPSAGGLIMCVSLCLVPKGRLADALGCFKVLGRREQPSESSPAKRAEILPTVPSEGLVVA